MMLDKKFLSSHNESRNADISKINKIRYMNDSIGRLINWVVKHKYLAVTIAFLLILVFFDENNMLKHIQSKREEAQLKADIEQLQKEHDIVMRKLGELETDANMLEKVAREKYGMHLDNEEIFIIKD